MLSCFVESKLTTKEFLEKIAYQVNDSYENLEKIYRKSKFKLDWGFKTKSIEDGVKAYKRYKNSLKAVEGKIQNANNYVDEIISYMDNIKSKFNVRVSSNGFIAEFEYCGRSYTAFGNKKDLAIINAKKQCAIDNVKGDFISSTYFNDLSQLINEKLNVRRKKG